MENNANLKGYRVCLEAGHGYHDDAVYDSGANNRGIHEHVLNAAQVEHVAKLLEAQGCGVTKVICTKGNGLSLRERGLQGKGHHLFVSFHHNAANKKAQGCEVFSHTLGTATDRKLAGELADALSKALNFANRGAKKAQLGVLKSVPETVAAAVLTESYFMDNDSLDTEQLEPLSLKAADAIADALAAFLLANCKPKRVVAAPVKADLPPAEPQKVEPSKLPWKK